MKSGKLALLFVMIVAGSLALVAQTQPNLLNGMPPLGSYDGSNVDTVNLVNGNLTLHIPLPFDYPQRGNLGIKYYFVINSKTWQAQGDPNTMTGQWWPTSGCGTGTSGPCGQDPLFASTASFGMTRVWTKVWPDGQAPTYSATIPDQISTWDGSSHDVAGTALDTSGYSVQVSGDDGTGVYTTATIISRDGTQYIGEFPTGGLGSCSVDGNGLAGATQTTTCTQQWTLTSVMDANGNVLNPPVPIPGTVAQATFSSAHQAVGTESAGCFTSYGTPWIYYFSYPAPNGQTNQLKLCFAPYPQLATSFSQSGVHQFQDNYSGHPFPGTWRPPVYLTNVILPDNTQWSLTYDSFGEVTSLGTPTGSTIQYGWGEGSFPRCNVAGNDITKVSRAVLSRTMTDANGHSFTWNYQWTPQAADGTLTHTVTDSSRNDSAHVFKDLTAADITPVCDFRETQTVSYQGTGGSRKPLQQVDTTWLHNRQVRAVPTDEKTTVFPSQKVSLVHMDYDPSALPIGIVTSKKTYDWGQGGPGALLREEDTVYEWQKDGRYLTANLLDLPASKVVISPVAASNVKSSCPVDGSGTLKACMAETDYTYDEPTYLTSYENTVGALPSGSHMAAPNPVRGNLTTVSSWLSTGGAVINHTNWYDTGEAYQATDPLGHLTTHSYDLAYKGVLPTKTCNAKNQCVSATYDLNTGLLASFTDANGSYTASGTTQGDPAHTTNYSYDLMRRVKSAISPADSQGQQPQTTFNFPNATTVQKSKTITPNLSDSLTTHIDGLGHVSRTEHATPAGSALADLTYSGSGHVVTASNPYFTTNDATYGTTTSQYDGLDRVIQTTKQDGSISRVAYNVVTAAALSGDCTQTTDEAGKQRGTCSDALGRLVEVDEPSGAPVQANYHALMQQDGNFVLLNAAGTSVWSTGSGATNAASIFMQDDGNLVTYIFKWQAGVYAAASPGPFPSSSCSIGTYLVAGQFLPSGKCIVSPHGQYFLLMNTDGNLFIYDWAHGTGTWGPGTQGHPGAYAVFQTDGNFVVYDANGGFLWNSGTSGTYAERLDMNDDGRIIIWKSAWNSGTSNGQFNGTTYTHPGCDVGIGTGTTGLLWSGQCFVSPNGRFELLMQADGNMVVYDRSVTPNAAIWSTGTGLSTADPSVAYRTLYFYDALGNLYCVEQHGDAASGTACPATPPGPTDAPVAPDPNNAWRRRLFAYDSLSRLRWASNPESGVITYTYDADGELLQKTSPLANQTGTATQTVSYCYDELHRVTGKGYGAQSCPLATPVVTYAYDSGNNAKGHLTSLLDQAGTASYTYDILGRLATETRTLIGANNASIPKTVSYEYNLDGSLYKLHYPSGNIITYTPWNNGNVAVSIPMEAKDQGSGINYVTGATYGADISLAGFVSGSGGPAAITNSFTYNKRLQPVTMSATAPSQTVYSIGYDFHAGNGTPGSGTDNGNVFGIINYKDTTHGRDQTFTYDALNRLLTAQNAGTNCSTTVLQNKTEYWGNSYGYDAWGNLLQKSITKCGAEHFSVTADAHNWIHSTAPDYQYDAAGNMTFDATASFTYTYDQENRLTGAAGYTYAYDADGNRVRKSNGNLAANGTLYWYMTPGIVSETDLAGTIKSEYIFFDGERVARHDGATGAGGVFYYFSDHLKTASIITDSAGVIKAESDYYPWGGELKFVDNDSNDYKFTGKKRDLETGLDYFGARYYSNGLGRWVSADWSPKPIPVPYADFIDPQSLNQYGYVRNLPTTRIDTDGHEGGTAAATWDLVTGGGAEGAEISAGFWAVGSVALPGLLGGGLGYVAVNSTAENNNIVANAQMQNVVASNKLIMAQQAALSKDAQAGALIKDGKDANAAAKATVEAAIAGLAAGKYKDATDVQAHIDKLKEGMKDVARATEALKNAVGQKARDAAKELLKKATKEVKGHEKDLQQKPKIKAKEEK